MDDLGLNVDVDGDQFVIDWSTLLVNRTASFFEQQEYIRNVAWQRKFEREDPEAIGIDLKKLLILYPEESAAFQPLRIKVNYAW